jgi:ectoine hydroxylase-related dioxygenase (phytanoyl-CoA dioxygenase family)
MDQIDTAVRQIQTDGYAIVPDLIAGERLRRAQDDAEALLEATSIDMPGLDGPIRGRMRKGLFRASRAFDDLYSHPTVTAIVSRVLVPGTKARFRPGRDIQLSSCMIKDVVPREGKRMLHQDDVVYPIARPRAPVMVNTLLALDPFSRRTGGTLVVPGSHLWTCQVEQDRTCVVVEMAAGSIVLFDGAIWHNNGANETTDQYRRALNIYYSAGWLRQMEGPFLGLTTAQALQLPAPLQAII